MKISMLDEAELKYVLLHHVGERIDRQVVIDIVADLKRETPEQRAEREKQEADESRFYCPHCRAYKPDHMFNMQVANLPGIGTVHWMIAVCGICRNIVSEMLIGYQMDSELMQAVKAGGGRRGGIIS